MGGRFARAAALSLAALLSACGGHASIPAATSAFRMGSPAQAQGSKFSAVTLFTFNGLNGSNPQSPFVTDSSGDFFGAASSGGSTGGGVAFKLHGNGKAYAATVLYTFPLTGGVGSAPGPLTFDSSGNLWGETKHGIVELRPGPKEWSATLVYRCFEASYDDRRVTVSNGAVYATCFDGKVLKIAPSGTGFSTQVLYQFATHGSRPTFVNGGPAVDSKGDVFGTATTLGLQCCSAAGPTFELTPSGGSYKYSVLFVEPTGYGPLLTSDGTLYETGFYPGPSGYGDLYQAVSQGGHLKVHALYHHIWRGVGAPAVDASGDVFFSDGVDAKELIPAQGEYKASIIAAFGSGVNPLWIDASGTLYGATSSDGGYGTFFKLVP